MDHWNRNQNPIIIFGKPRNWSRNRNPNWWNQNWNRNQWLWNHLQLWCSTSCHSLTPPQRGSDKLYRSNSINGQDNYPQCINKLANHHIAVVIIGDRLSMCVGSMRLFPTIPKPPQNSQRGQSKANLTQQQEKKLRLEWGWYQEYCWINWESQQQR